MARFDVHANPGRNSAIVPCVVNIQSRRIDASATRIVGPLVRPPEPRDSEPWLPPRFIIGSETAYLDPLTLFAAPAAALGPVVA